MKDRDKAIERSFLRHEVKIEIVCEVKELQLIRRHFTHILSSLLREQRFNGHISRLN